MRLRREVRSAACLVLVIAGLGWLPARAEAQSNVGSGPLTGTLPDTEPVTGFLNVGPVRFAPGLTVREIGWDSNVFDEPDDTPPKEDWVAAALPDVSAFTRLRWVQISAYAGVELTYYRTYESERSVGQQFRGRFDFLLSRLRPFVGGGILETRMRPNGEIDVRADRREEELSTGVAFELSPTSLVYASGFVSGQEYENAFEDGVNIGQTLTREGHEYQAGLKTDLTPLLSMQLYGSFHEDLFTYEPQRNTESYAGTVKFGFAPDAVVQGTATLTYRDLRTVDPEVRPYRGMLGSVTLSYPFLELGRFTFNGVRNIEYSFDTAEAYYLENSFTLMYTHRIVGDVDVQARGSKSWFDYSASLTAPEHEDTLDIAGASLGYNLPNRTRIALNYEFARRRSPEYAQRNYDRRRIYLSWLFAF